MAQMRLDVGPYSFTKTIIAADLARLEAAVRKKFRVPAEADSQQAAAAYAEHLWNETKKLVRFHERSQAASAAMSGVEEIVLT